MPEVSECFTDGLFFHLGLWEVMKNMWCINGGTSDILKILVFILASTKFKNTCSETITCNYFISAGKRGYRRRVGLDPGLDRSRVVSPASIHRTE